MQELGNKLLGLMAIRVLVVLSVLLPYLLFSPAEDGPRDGSLISGIDDWFITAPADETTELLVGEPRPKNEVLQLLIGIVSFQTLLGASLLKLMRSRLPLQVILQLAGDLLLITLMLYKFGEVTANMSILYFAVISIASFLLRKRSGLLVATMAIALYGGVCLAHQSPGYRALWEPGGLLAPASPLERLTGEPAHASATEKAWLWLKPPPPEEVTGVPVSYNLAIHFVGFFSMALFTSFLARDQALEAKLERRSQDLARLQVLYRDVIHSISSGLMTTDLTGAITSLNRAGEEILGRQENDLFGVHAVEADLLTEDQWHTYTRESEQSLTRGEHEILRHGSLVYLGFTLTHLRDTEGELRGHIIIFQDLTEWRQLQDRVRIQDRMAALGQMAAGLAHEVGNPLAAISGSVQLLAGSLEGNSSQSKLLQITLKESRRLDRTVKSFLQFARPRGRNTEQFDIAALLHEDAQLLRNSDDVLPEHIIEVELEPPSATIAADIDHIGQLFWNLARNSLQAMPEGGELTIVGQLREDFYHIEFRDTGRGMSAHERDQLFQPFKSFFDGGTGLGMAIVYRIVDEHAGNIGVESEPGRGTIIKVQLPLQSETQEILA